MKDENSKVANEMAYFRNKPTSISNQMGYVITMAIFHRISSILQMIKWIEWSPYEKEYEIGYCLPTRAQLAQYCSPYHWNEWTKWNENTTTADSQHESSTPHLYTFGFDIWEIFMYWNDVRRLFRRLCYCVNNIANQWMLVVIWDWLK